VVAMTASMSLFRLIIDPSGVSGRIIRLTPLQCKAKMR